MPLCCLRHGTGSSEPPTTVQGTYELIPRHEWPGRIVLTLGLIISSLCVVALIILLLG